ncbi:MAG: low specificity L-threonine aldolase [Clostridia bacterium]|nr:low specificity L-threonine aldolase [Clostridia bacterium]
MLYFENDYSEGACKEVLESLIETNFESVTPYGGDIYSDRAKEKIRIECGCPDADIYFLVGGTQTNKTVIDAVLDRPEGVIAAKTGHISVHEAGAVEYTGHKVIELEGIDGKLPAEALKKYIAAFDGDESRDHMVFPGMVYISHPTEYGTLYTLDELTELSEICRGRGLTLFLDGARLGYGLMTPGTDVTIKDIARLTDVFYIGGTKVGALCGEAVVFTHGNTPRYFFTKVKQQGALLAKGRLIGVQFDRLFTDGLYYEISRHAIACAEKLRSGLKDKGYRFFSSSPTNQIFIIVEDKKLETLREKAVFSFWEKYDEGHTVIRFVTCWATKEEDVDALLSLM